MAGENPQILPPRVSLVDVRTGQVTREWYDWLRNLRTAVQEVTNNVFLVNAPVDTSSYNTQVTTTANQALNPATAPPTSTAVTRQLDRSVSDAMLTASRPDSQAVLREFDKRIADALFLASRPNPQVSQLERRLSDLETLVAFLPRQTYAPESGLYTPVLDNTTNVAASTAYECQWARVRNCVTVSGKVDVDPTAAASTVLGISLPFPSNIGAAEDCGGTAFASGIAGQGAAILGDSTNNRAAMQWIAVDVTNQPMYFLFQYLVI